MRLLIISAMPHHLRADGRVVGWGATVQELDHLATRFDTVRHIACLHPGEAPASALPYASDRIELIPVPPTGGDHLHDKLSVLASMPTYIAAMLRELPHADVVHLRCPANVPMIASVLLPLLRAPRTRWIKYAGNWKPDRHDSLAFAFQRWFLAKSWHRATVTVNGEWPGQPTHVRSFFNPSLTDEELGSAHRLVSDKRLTLPLRLLFVGRLEGAKGVGLALEVMSRLRIDATLDLIGDGPERHLFEAKARQLTIEHRVVFHGWMPRSDLSSHYARAHLMLFPTATEGWPKVLSEGMAYGVVPIASAVGAIPQYLTRFELGRALNRTADDFAAAILAYHATPDQWLTESRRAQTAATQFSYTHYLSAVDALLAS